MIDLHPHHIVQALHCSTGHIPRETSQALGENHGQPSYAPLWDALSYTHWGPHGWIIFCSPEQAGTAKEEGHPALAALMEFALQHGHYYLWLDADAMALPEEAGLPVFDW